MATAVDICNYALGYLGDPATLTSLEPPEGSAQADHLARYYPMALSEALGAYHWTFACTRKALPRLADADESLGYRYVYALPADCLRLIELYDAAGACVESELFGGMYSDVGADWTTELVDGRLCLLCKREVGFVRYVTSKVPPARFSPQFAEALAHLVASKIAGSMVPGDSGIRLAQNQMQLYDFALRRAMVADADQTHEYARPHHCFMGDFRGDEHNAF